MKIGILTFHRVYNYGAVIQAYCTQKIVDNLGFSNEIIDYTIPKQKDFTDLYSKRNGIKRFVKTLLLLPFHNERVVRKKKFDLFINSMTLSAKSYTSNQKLYETNKDYDCFLVGSDQVWNVTKKAEASDAYFLNFVEKNKKKVSYASSIGVATYDDLVKKKEYLMQFNSISCREIGGAKILSNVVGTTVKTVLDPTLLVEKKVLQKLTLKIDSEPYILYYSLDGFDQRNRNSDILHGLAQKFNLKIKFVTPEWPYHNYGEDVRNAGPGDFLSLIRDAKLVCTNSFHGTALSIKLGTPFYVLETVNLKDERKRSILRQLSLEDRLLSSVEEVERIKSYDMNFNDVNLKLEQLMETSITYLKQALCDTPEEDHE